MDSDAEGGRPRLFKWLTVLVVVLFGVAITFIVAWVILQWSIAESVYSTKASLDWFGITFYRDYTFIAAGLFALLFVYPRPGGSDLWRLATVLFKRVRPYEAEQEGMRLSEKLNVWVWALWQTLKWAIAFYAFSVSGGFPFLGPIMNPIMMMTMGLGSWSDVPRVFALPLNPASGAGIVGLMPTMSIQYAVVSYVLSAFLLVFAARMFFRLLANLPTRRSDIWVRTVSYTHLTLPTICSV